eukprot:TRINITY_DN474_c0_g1_i10.p3 TRINITY_DN474_c0_g1~~TRINITY_DN474_c0_g1_i10.p3  ORF type:complete len:247 (+),score=103.21 TRINITY_DN474_c0_g1_i10:412-1152(+)
MALEAVISCEDAVSLSVVGSTNEVHLTGNVEVQLDDDSDSESDDMDGMNEEMLRNLTRGGPDGDSADDDDDDDDNDDDDGNVDLPLIKQSAVVEELQAAGSLEPTLIDADEDAGDGKTAAAPKGGKKGGVANGGSTPAKKGKKGKGGGGGGGGGGGPKPSAPATADAKLAAPAKGPKGKAAATPPKGAPGGAKDAKPSTAGATPKRPAAGEAGDAADVGGEEAAPRCQEADAGTGRLRRGLLEAVK